MGEQDGEVDPDHLIDAQDFYDQVLAASEGSRIGEMVNILDNNKASKAQKTKTALKHFNDFLCKQYWPTVHPTEVVRDSEKLYERLTFGELNLNLFGCFANYLADCDNKTEKKRGNEVKISLGSAQGYFSSCEVIFSRSARDTQCPKSSTSLLFPGMVQTEPQNHKCSGGAP